MTISGRTHHKKNNGDCLKASPWKIKKEVDNQENNNLKNGCARKLFILKPKEDKGVMGNERINEVTEKISAVDIQENDLDEGEGCKQVNEAVLIEVALSIKDIVNEEKKIEENKDVIDYTGK